MPLYMLHRDNISTARNILHSNLVSSMATPTRTGTVPFQAGAEKCETWYQVYGDLDSGVTPLVAIHGGPGSTHHYILSLIDLAAIYSVPVIFYDQLGNGNSTHLPEKTGDAGSFWREELFLNELDNLLRHLNIQDNYSLLGQSWGGMLASRHASRRPKGLKRLVIADSPAEIRLFQKVAYEELIPKLPPDVRVSAHRAQSDEAGTSYKCFNFQDTLLKHEAAGTTDSKEYQDAMVVFYKRHLCRVDPWPAELLQSFEWMEKDHTVYSIMSVSVCNSNLLDS